MAFPPFSARDTTAAELMDDPAADERLLFNTYRQFVVINRLYSRWRTIYARRIRPHLHRAAPRTLLDIGFGGGDIPAALARWAKEDGVKLNILAIDPDPRALRFARNLPMNGVDYAGHTARDIDASGQSFDFVVSNAVLHHLPDAEVRALLEAAGRLTRHTAIMNDIVRSPVAYAFFGLVTPLLFRDSFTCRDGLTSIRRSYRPRELRAIVPPGWRVETMFPYRQLAILTR
jgi:2-polyprenyl-3-methyl-5-hydroxy-6-metoxy-1,4-benzoquinol methylase